jgi:hypothetical protein
MNKSLLLLSGKNAKKRFEFLYSYGYIIAEYKIINNSEFKIAYINNVVNKKVDIRLYNHDDVERFFLNAFITKLPYSTVNDLIDMTTYFDKNNIKLPEVLENNQRNCENVNEYIKTYAELFEKYAIELITTDKQFPHYFPEWT